ncbi:MAG: hypothetical protein WAL15_04550 [Xanthobacteraceae bacterium]|jgi:hypothetical protein
MRAVLLSLSLLVVVAIGAASAQGYYDRVYRGASPDPTDNRYDARPELDGRADAERAARARRKADEDEPVLNTRRGSGADNEECDSRRASRPGDRGC